MSAIARPLWAINHVLAYGQSLSTGWEGTPVLSRHQPFDTLMLGHCVRPLREFAPEFVPVGDGGLHPLVATVQAVEGGPPLSARALADLPAEAIGLGETVLEGATRQWRAQMLRRGARLGRGRLLASACGVGGRALEALGSGATPRLFDRLRDAIRLGGAAARDAGLSYGVSALLFLQGENNNFALNGATDTAEGYFSLLRAFCDDFRAELTGQPPPAVFLYQTGGGYAVDRLGVAMAQLRAGLELPGVFLAAPSYPVSDKGGHLDANGYRWLGMQFGKVMHAVIDLGQRWRPLHPLEATRAGRQVTLRFHVPVPPLRFGACCAGRQLVRFDDGGFFVGDAAGEIALEGIRIAPPDGVVLDLARMPGAGLFVRYAGRSRHGGRGNLHDSDRTVAEDSFAPDGLATIEGLSGRAYPLMNWCVAFSLAIG